ncbi:MAG: hypothetical protein KF791_04195 [Verrucomicrobiae bacterium]|nr:hypothetical protein [Verrucomicrobiae bacterium]
MRRWGLAAVLVLFLAGWHWRERLFPGEVVRVRRVLDAVAADVSFEPSEQGIAAGRRISRLVDHFSAEAHIEVEILGVGTFNLNGRGEIQQAMWVARREARRLEVRFLDIVVELGPDGRTSVAHLTATAEITGNRRRQEGFEAMEFRFFLEQVDGAWKVRQVETIQTLKQ